jgi:predicted transcriptional regulator
MELVRKQTYITPSQHRAVKRLAQQQRTTEAEILRKALDQFLAREGIVET